MRRPALGGTLTIIVSVFLTCGCETTGVRCGEGTIRDEGLCVPVSDASCGAGTVLVDGRCVAQGELSCGEGTALVDGQCVPLDDLCPPGEGWVEGACESVLACGAGTLLVAGECRPVDALPTATDRESVEPNDPYEEGGQPKPVPFPELGETLTFEGRLGWRSDGSADVDSFEYLCPRDTALRIELTPTDAAGVMFAHYYHDPNGFDLRTETVPSGRRNAVRTIAALDDGVCRIQVRALRFRGPAMVAEGGYLLAITRVELPAPRPVSAVDEVVDLATVQEWTIDAPPGSWLSVEPAGNVLTPASDSDGFFRPNLLGQGLSAGSTLRFFAQLSIFPVPEADNTVLRPFATYVEGDVRQRMRIRTIPEPELITLRAGETIEPPAVELDVGGAHATRIEAAEPMVLLYNGSQIGGRGDFVTPYSYLAQELDPVAHAHPSVIYPAVLEAFLEPGEYWLLFDDVREPDATADPVEQTFEARPVSTFDGGVLRPSFEGAEVTAASPPMIFNPRAFIAFDIDGLPEGTSGYLTLEVETTSLSALVVDVSLTPDVNDLRPLPGAPMFTSAAEPGRGTFLVRQGERIHIVASNLFFFDPLEVTVRARLLAGPVVLEREPNDRLPDATDLGRYAGDLLSGRGSLGPSSSGVPEDLWRFEMPARGNVELRTSLEGAEDTVLYLLDALGRALAFNDNLDSQGRNKASRIRGDLPAGTYYLVVRSFGLVEEGGYSVHVAPAPTFPAFPF